MGATAKTLPRATERGELLVMARV